MDKKENNLLPSIPLEEIFGPNHVLNPRASFSNYGWMPNDPMLLNFSTGAPLTIAGDMPFICSHSVATHDSLSLMRMANLSIAPFRYEYQTRKEYSRMLDLLSRQNKKLVINYLHPPEECNHKGYWLECLSLPMK